MKLISGGALSPPFQGINIRDESSREATVEFEIGRILHLKSEIRNRKLNRVQSEILDFGFEMQDSSNFTIPPLPFQVGEGLQRRGSHRRQRSQRESIRGADPPPT